MLNADNLLAHVEALGGRLEARGEQLHIEAPRGVITPELKEDLKSHKPELLQLLNQQASNKSVTEAGGALETFNQEAMDIIKSGQSLRRWSGDLKEWLYWVRGTVERDELLAEGCEHIIYTLDESEYVKGSNPEDFRNIHKLKQEFNATIGEDFDYEQ